MSGVRSVLERLSRNRVLRRRLPRQLGGQSLWVTPDSSLRLWRPGLLQADPLLFQCAQGLVGPGSVVWDVGANVGLFTFAAAHLAGPRGRVLALEADDWLCSLMRRSAAAAPSTSAPVTILAVAISERCGIECFAVAQRGRAASHLVPTIGSTQAGGAREVRSVVTVTLDWLLGHFPAPGLVKLDVEGAEMACLRGAVELLSVVRPAILCEVSGDNARSVASLFRNNDYVFFDAALAAETRQPLSFPVWNTLALPAETTPPSL